MIQAVVLGIVLGPITHLLGMGSGLLWNCLAMFAAPFVVDAMKPVVHINREEAPVVMPRYNALLICSVTVCVLLLLGIMAIALAFSHPLA